MFQELVDYVFRWYTQVYKETLPNLTLGEVYEACLVYLCLTPTDFGADSVDRERVRDIMLLLRGRDSDDLEWIYDPSTRRFVMNQAFFTKMMMMVAQREGGHTPNSRTD
jgi:hypothetical protein